jgi:hypothetical protein
VGREHDNEIHATEIDPPYRRSQAPHRLGRLCNIELLEE